MSVPLITKKKCESCKKKPGILSTCYYCQSIYCFNCLQQEIHSCVNILVMKEDKRDLLKQKLEAEKCVRIKISPI